jgi:hypothetical protein
MQLRQFSTQWAALKMLDNACMTLATRRYQHPVRDVPTIVKDCVPRKRRHVTIRFLHDQIGCRKVPIAALTACKSGIQTPLGDPAEPERQRSNPRMQDNFG